LLLKSLVSTDHRVIGLIAFGNRMRGFYTVETQADYDAWLAEEAALLAAA